MNKDKQSLLNQQFGDLAEFDVKIEDTDEEVIENRIVNDTPLAEPARLLRVREELPRPRTDHAPTQIQEDKAKKSRKRLQALITKDRGEAAALSIHKQHAVASLKRQDKEARLRRKNALATATALIKTTLGFAHDGYKAALEEVMNVLTEKMLLKKHKQIEQTALSQLRKNDKPKPLRPQRRATTKLVDIPVGQPVVNRNVLTPVLKNKKKVEKRAQKRQKQSKKEIHSQ